MAEPKTKRQPRAKPPAKPAKEYELKVYESETNPFTGKVQPVIPKGYVSKYTQEDISNHLLVAFELWGGVSRLVLWGDQNETEFVKLVAKLMPDPNQQKNGQTQAIQINLAGGANIPSSPLDDVVIRDESVINAQWVEKNK